MLVCDGLKGLPDSVSAVWEKTIAQTCIVHLLSITRDCSNAPHS